jgi:predicted dehydrogenase
MENFRVGLIGLGGVAEAHLAAYRQVQDVQVVAGAELQKDRLDQMADKWGFRGYPDFEEMLDKERLNIVCILTPPRTHRELVERVAPRGVSILCEKPLATTVQDAAAIVEICETSGVKLCYGASYRFLPACRKAKEMIDQGRLGRIALLLEMYIGGEGAEHYRDLGPSHYPAGGPGGGGMGLVDHGIHLVDLFSWFADCTVRYVTGRGNYSGRPPGTEYLTMVFDSGAVGHLIYSEATYSSDLPNEGVFSLGGAWDIHGLQSGGGWSAHPGNIRVHGEEGALRVFHYANKLYFSGREKLEEIPLINRPMPGNFAMQMESLVARLKEGREPEVTGSDGLRALQVVLAAYESFESRRIVELGPMTATSHPGRADIRSGQADAMQ